MKKQIIKEFITVKYVQYLPKPELQLPPAPRRILVVGQCTLDMVSVCDTYPLNKTAKNIGEGYWRRGGSASNICTVISRLGAECEFLGLLSSAPAFQNILYDFLSSGIEAKNCPCLPLNPPLRSIILARDKGTCTVIENTNRKQELQYQQFLGACDFRRYNWIHFEARNARETYRMISAVREYNQHAEDNIIISIDLPNLLKQNLTLADLADYVFVSKETQDSQYWMNGYEACRTMREKLHNHRAARQLTQKRKIPYEKEYKAHIDEPECEPTTISVPVVICADTLHGACCVEADNNFIKTSGNEPYAILDKHGENDVFCAAVIFAINSAKMSLRDALEYATRVTSFKVANMGFDKLRCVPKNLISFFYQ